MSFGGNVTTGNWSHRIAVVVACVSTATLLRLLLQPVLGAPAVFLLALLAVAVSAHLAGLTAYASNRDREEALAAGYCEHVPKPAPPYQIARVIAAAVRRPS